MKTIFTIALFCLISCKGKEEKKPRHFLIGYSVDQYGAYTVNAFFSEGNMQSMSYFEKVVLDAYKCEGYQVDNLKVTILSISELEERDFKKFKGDNKWPRFCEPDSSKDGLVGGGVIPEWATVDTTDGDVVITADSHVFDGKYELPVGKIPHTIPIKFSGSGGNVLLKKGKEIKFTTMGSDTIPQIEYNYATISYTDTCVTKELRVPYYTDTCEANRSIQYPIMGMLIVTNFSKIFVRHLTYWHEIKPAEGSFNIIIQKTNNKQ